MDRVLVGDGRERLHESVNETVCLPMEHPVAL
jgi:hypothetical protein